uniref:Protein PHLOEM PROTEIN 2-LIKE A1 n=1 Tax=Noccaea caerulescens TaxID=107243 RepID=A0A1J3G170_NOCCA
MSFQERSIAIISAVDAPHNYEAILRDADLPVSPSIVEQLRSGGVFLEPNLIKYWVDEKNNNCFMLFPRKLSITWSDDPNYWTWFRSEESPKETDVEAAELKNVCWLDISGKFNTSKLTPGVTYEVVFKVRLEDPAYGWDTPLNLKLAFSNGKEKPHERKVSLREQPRYQWVDIRVGEFQPENNSAGEIAFSMYEYEAGVWKKGLFLKGVAIRPKYN